LTIKSGTWVGHLNAILGQGGGCLNEPIFKSSNAWGVAGGGMLKLRIDRRINGYPNVYSLWRFSRPSQFVYLKENELTNIFYFNLTGLRNSL